MIRRKSKSRTEQHSPRRHRNHAGLDRTTLPELLYLFSFPSFFTITAFERPFLFMCSAAALSTAAEVSGRAISAPLSGASSPTVNESAAAGVCALLPGIRDLWAETLGVGHVCIAI